MRAVYLNPITNKLTDRTQVHHLANVLRLKKGEKLIVFDGSHTYQQAVITHFGKREIALELSEEKSYKATHSIELALAWIKKEAFEDALNTAVQIGVSKIHLYRSDYAAKPQDLEKARIKKLMISAMEQSNHFLMPELLTYSSLENLWESQKDKEHIAFSLKTKNVSQPNFNKNQNLIYWIGPEGGLSDREIKYLSDKNVNFFHLSTPIMRAPVAVSCAMGYILGNTNS